jgi:hypothetical protein
MNKTIAFIVAIILIVGGTYLWQATKNPPVDPLGEVVTVYLTPDCGCCAVYVEYLKRKGVRVEEIVLDDLSSIKKEHGITIDLWSCHTSVVAGYVVEGHVPLEVIVRLLDERPDIRGIALPAMPPGTPGMPGPKRSEWIFYSIGHDGEVSEYLKM